MLGPTLALTAARRSTGAAATPPWWATPDHLLDGIAPALVADFVRGRYALGAEAAFGDCFALSSGTKTVVDAAGLLATVAADTPAWDWSTGRRRLLLEPAPATNLCLQANALGSTAWAANAVTIASDAVVGWSGVSDLDRVTETASGSVLRFVNPVPIVAGATYTVSCVLRRENVDWVRLIVSDSSSAFSSRSGRVWFNLATGAVGTAAVTGTAHAITGARCAALGNGLWRCSFQVVTTGYATLMLGAMTAAADASTDRANVGSGAGIGSAFAMGYVQVELGATPTSWIATTIAAVTRIADDLRLAAAPAGWFAGASLAVALRGRAAALAAPPILLGTDAGLRLAEITAAGHLASGDGATTLDAPSGGGPPTADFGAVIAHDASGRRAALTGGAVASDTAGWGATPTALRLGGTTATPGGPLWLDAIEIWRVGGTAAAAQAQARVWS